MANKTASHANSFVPETLSTRFSDILQLNSFYYERFLPGTNNQKFVASIAFGILQRHKDHRATEESREQRGKQGEPVAGEFAFEPGTVKEGEKLTAIK